MSFNCFRNEIKRLVANFEITIFIVSNDGKMLTCKLSTLYYHGLVSFAQKTHKTTWSIVDTAGAIHITEIVISLIVSVINNVTLE